MSDNLTEDQARLLLQIEQWSIAQHGATEARYRRDLDVLKDLGYVACTRVHWVITDAGRRRLVPVDGRTRLTIGPWTRRGAPPPGQGGV